MINVLRELELERRTFQVQSAEQRIAIANGCEAIAARLSFAEGIAAMVRPVTLGAIAALLIWATRGRSRGWLVKSAILVGLGRRIAALWPYIKNLFNSIR